MSIYHVEDASCSSSDSLDMHLRWNDTRIVIRFDLSSLATSVPPIGLTRIERFNSAYNADNYDEAEALLGEVLSVIVERGSPVFDHLAPAPRPGAATSHNLHSLLFREESTFNVGDLCGNAIQLCDVTYAQENKVQDGPYSLFQLSVDKRCDLPRYSTTDILVIENLSSDSHVALVVVDGQSMCSKTGDINGENAAQRELDCLWKITTSDYATTLRVPKLLGLIETPDGERVVGFLEEYIPVSDSWELSTLGHIDVVLGIEEARRKKWASQVQETVRLLHQIGVVWGDGKPSNVLIHSDSDDAWVIDFGGGWTGSWLDREVGGTVEGDELAVKTISEFLEV
ncbi:hypothetical protein K4F52_004836 [Lecanicillium sp. MT-2017a]|nr:hypothetical protein K4F52_004836 [Lecanicillium sp. MT-2017a]